MYVYVHSGYIYMYEHCGCIYRHLLHFHLSDSTAFRVAPGGYAAHSLAVMTDAAHLLTDFGSILISLFSLWISSKPASKTLTFGWHRSGYCQLLMALTDEYVLCFCGELNLYIHKQSSNVVCPIVLNPQSCVRFVQRFLVDFCRFCPFGLWPLCLYSWPSRELSRMTMTSTAVPCSSPLVVPWQ